MKNKIIATLLTILIISIIYFIWTLSADFIHKNKWQEELIPLLTMLGLIVCALIVFMWIVIYYYLNNKI